MQLWLIPILTAVGLALILWVGQLIARERSVRSIRFYRRQYLHLIQRLERCTLVLNQVVHALKDIKDKDFWNQYESLLGRFQNVLTLTRDVAPFGTSVLVMKSAHDVVNDLDKRISRLMQSAALLSSGKPVITNRPDASALPLGCYFCSRPFTYTGLVRVKVKIEGRAVHAASCTHCRKELEKTQKVRVLYFVKNGTPKHWTEVSEYNPVTDFANLQSANIQMQTKKLELIKNNDD